MPNSPLSIYGGETILAKQTTGQEDRELSHSSGRLIPGTHPLLSKHPPSSCHFAPETIRDRQLPLKSL